jgi:hypothetical protein
MPAEDGIQHPRGRPGPGDGHRPPRASQQTGTPLHQGRRHALGLGLHPRRRRATVPVLPDPQVQRPRRGHRPAAGAAARPEARRRHAHAAGGPGAQNDRRPARPLQRRADRRHLPQRRRRARPQSGSRRRAAGPERGQEPARRRQRPQAQRSCNGRDHCLTIRLPGTRPPRRVAPPCPNDRGPGRRQPGAPAGLSACPKRENERLSRLKLVPHWTLSRSETRSHGVCWGLLRDR